MRTADSGCNVRVRFVEMLPMAGASISVVTEFGTHSIFGAIDALAVRLEGRQSDLGIGPHWDALRTELPSNGWFDPAATASGLPGLTPHELRHTAVSLAVSAGANVMKAAQGMLGHASAAITLDRYADLFEDDLDAVAVALDHAALRSNVGEL